MLITINKLGRNKDNTNVSYSLLVKIIQKLILYLDKVNLICRILTLIKSFHLRFTANATTTEYWQYNMADITSYQVQLKISMN